MPISDLTSDWFWSTSARSAFVGEAHQGRRLTESDQQRRLGFLVGQAPAGHPLLGSPSTSEAPRRSSRSRGSAPRAPSRAPDGPPIHAQTELSPVDTTQKLTSQVVGEAAHDPFALGPLAMMPRCQASSSS